MIKYIIGAAAISIVLATVLGLPVGVALLAFFVLFIAALVAILGRK